MLVERGLGSRTTVSWRRARAAARHLPEMSRMFLGAQTTSERNGSPFTNVNDLFEDFTGAAFWAGVTAFIWYAFGAVPLQIAVAQQLDLTTAQTSSWIFIVWFSGAVWSIVLSVYYRQPIPITWSIPGLVYMGTLAGDFSFSELVGANLLAGVLIVVLGFMGIGQRIMSWLPLPLLMGMFAGSILGYITRLVRATVDDILIVGLTVMGYLLARWLRDSRVPPVGVAVAAGGLAIFWTHEGNPVPVEWIMPELVFPEMAFSLPAFVAVTLPMVVLTLGLGNVQGLGFLVAQGFKVRVTPITIIVGINSVINAFLGGHTAIVARTGVAILASPDAGPLSGRYWANLIAAPLTILIALAAEPLTSTLSILPKSYVFALAGLAILASFQDALEKAFVSQLKLGALVAFVVAATPFAFAGITSAFWALLAGMVVSLIVEWPALKEYWAS